MTKYRFVDDYSEGCHPGILDALTRTNLSQQEPYGADQYSDRAKQLIRSHLNEADTPIYFVAGGTQANILIAASVLRSHESIIAANCGHIVGSEAGAIEATGHQVITVPHTAGKLTPDQIDALMDEASRSPFSTRPRLVYISNATEFGTIYDRDELAALAQVCQANGLLLWLDGARLAAALAGSPRLTLKDLEEYTDVFWIGGTKAGALLGEAIVIPNSDIANDFAVHLKQRGALLSKGRVLGLQFAELFEHDLIFELAHEANSAASRLASAIQNAGYELYVESECNLVFATLPDDLIARLNEHFEIYIWKRLATRQSVVRLATSWATKADQLDHFIELISNA